MIMIVAVNIFEMRSGGAAYHEVLKAVPEASWRL
jgi:hypothetical protein